MKLFTLFGLLILGLTCSQQESTAQGESVETWVDYPKSNNGQREIKHPFIEDRGLVKATRRLPFTLPLADSPQNIARYSASGLPPGLTISESTGEISGVPLLSDLMEVVIHAEGEDGSMAFFRFHIDVAPNALPLSPHLRDTTFPQGPIVRVSSLPQTSNSLQPPFPINSAYVSLADDLPDGLEWTSTLEGITGIATESGVTALTYTSTWGEPEHTGELIFSAGDYRNAAHISGAVGQIALGGDIILGMTNDIRPLVRAVMPSEWSNEPIVALGANPPWPDETNLDTYRQAILTRYRDELFAYRTRSGGLYTSPNGNSWTHHPNALPPLPHDPDQRYVARDLFVTDGGAVITGYDELRGNYVTGVTSDWNQWNYVDSLQNGRLSGITAVCHNGTQWFAFTSNNGVHRSTDGSIWHLIGYPLNEPPSLSEHVLHKGRFYAITNRLSDQIDNNRYQIYYSDDTLTWHTLLNAPDESIERLITADDSFFCLSMNGVYKWNDIRAQFELLWMAPPGTKLTDADYSKGRLLVSTEDQAWLIDTAHLSPQLQGPQAFPNLDDVIAKVGDPFLYPLHSSGQNVSFKAYQLPAGITLNSNNGNLSGVFENPGVYEGIVSVVNEYGEGVPRRLRFFVHAQDAPHERISASFVHLHSPPTDTFPYPMYREHGPVTLYMEGVSDSAYIIAKDIPWGMQFDPETRILSGWPSVPGHYSIELHIFSATGSETTTASFLVYQYMDNVGMQNSQFEFAANSPIHIQEEVVDQSMTFVAYDFPSGLELNSITGEVTGSIFVPGRYDFLIGRITNEGIHAQPHVIQLDILGDQTTPSTQELPDLQTGFTEILPDVTSYEISYEDGVGVDDDLTFLTLPDGVTFIPPRAVHIESEIPVGMHVAQARISNESGFIDINWWFIRENPSAAQGEIELESGDTFHTCLGCSVNVKIDTELEEGSISIANLPPGLSLDPETRIISGAPDEAGDFTVKLMFIQNNESLAYQDVSIIVGETSGDNRLTAKQMYFTGLANQYIFWNPYLNLRLEEHGQIQSAQVPPGVSASPPYMGGKPTVQGEGSVRFTFTDGTVYQWPTMIYPSPVWGNDRHRVRLLPGQNLFQLSQLVLLESYTTFAPPVKFYSSGTGSQSWIQHSLPANAPYPAFTDIIGTPDGYLLSGEGWLATAGSIGGLNDAQEFYQTPSAMAYHQGLRVATTRFGDILFSEDNTLNRSWNLRYDRELHGLAYGNGRFVAVGNPGAIHIMTPNIDEQLVSSPVTSDLRDIIFSDGEFYAVGSEGTVILSTNGTGWTIDRHSRALGADFRYVTANSETVVAVSPYAIFGKRRSDPATGWQAMVRVPVENGMLDDLQWANGEFAGGFDTGLYVPRRSTASTTVLSAPYQAALAGAPFYYDIAATGDVPTFRVDELPEGLELDASSGAIRGVIAEAGIYQMLIEATAGGKTHGKTLTIHCWGGVPRIVDSTFEIPLGSIDEDPRTLRIDPPSNTFTPEGINMTPLFASAERSVFPGNREFYRALTVTTNHQIRWSEGPHTLRVHLSNPVGESTETITLETRTPKPSFPKQPQSVTSEFGARVELVAQLQGRLPIGLQWYYENEPISEGEGYSGTTSERLIIDSLTEAQLGSYFLRASNELGTTDSSVALVDAQSGFATWAAQYGFDPTDWLGDHDANGWSNLLEYALSVSSDTDLTSHFPILDGNHIAYLRAEGREDIDYILQHSENMNEWAPVDSPDIIIEPSDGNLESVRVPIETLSRSGFYRLLLRPQM